MCLNILQGITSEEVQSVVEGCELRNDLNAKNAKKMHAKNAKIHSGFLLKEINITFASFVWASFAFKLRSYALQTM
jgi:hypothetical protein